MNTAKGMTPIEKNIIVVDECGNEFEATYPKRAKGLVKAGRVRFIDENKICLARPPRLNSEDEKMTDINTNVDTDSREITNKDSELCDAVANNCEITMSYILEKLDYIAARDEHIMLAIEGIDKVSVNGPGAAGKATALADVVKCRETTNQKLIDLYKQMYEDIKPKKPPTVKQALEVFAKNAGNPLFDAETFSNVLDTLRHMQV